MDNENDLNDPTYFEDIYIRPFFNKRELKELRESKKQIELIEKMKKIQPESINKIKRIA